ncbi:cellulase family glycosylhydrolase [Natrinema halophilum]|uniref:Cellulase family glycosylhydrolase n=1 Tax=Natrinema halophilum TaxID=1699371 RepID=A0A7D5GTL2_9EURY|nr:cellulase family glycosylhydrolase [Natrinema halophilum]QLG50189.1 cellulase family glycosylhydrolase [Natrinema halophilum]
MARRTYNADGTDEPTTHADGPTSDGSGGPGTISRRNVMRAVGTTALTAGLAESIVGSVAAVGIDTPWLHRDGNLIRDESDNKVILRGVNIADPARLARRWRKKDWSDVFEKATDTSESNDGGWYNRIIRVPTQPQDISGVNNNLSPAHGDDWGPLLPGQIDESDMEAYFSNYMDPLVDAAEEAGVYVMIDYHRHFPVFHQPQNESDLGEYQCGTESFPNDLGFCGERGVLWNSEEQASEIDGYTEEYAAELDQELEMYWNFVAPRYSDRSHVIYDVYNEPTGPYAGDWGSPTAMPQSGNGEGGDDVDVVEQESKQYWDMWVDRAQPWIDTVREHADNLLTIGSPRWSQYTYWAPHNEFDGDDICYTGHAYTHDTLRPLSTYFGEPAEQVPVFFSEFGWAEGGGKDDFAFLEGTASEYAPEFEDFIENYPVHPIAWCFDHTFEPAFFKHSTSKDSTWEIWEYEARPGQWWQEFLYEHRNADLPGGGSSGGGDDGSGDGGSGDDGSGDGGSGDDGSGDDGSGDDGGSSGDLIAKMNPSTTSANVDQRIAFSVRDTSGSGRWITDLEWEFGDGTTATGWWNAHRYDSAGSYTVRLTATANNGDGTTHEVAITVS